MMMCWLGITTCACGGVGSIVVGGGALVASTGGHMSIRRRHWHRQWAGVGVRGCVGHSDWLVGWFFVGVGLVVVVFVGSRRWSY